MTFIRFMGPVLLSAALCGMMFLIRIDDAPDGGRKTQAAPVPSSGGVAILITLGLSAWLAGEAGLSRGSQRGHSEHREGRFHATSTEIHARRR